MDVKRYCQIVDQKSSLQKEGIKSIPVKEDHSPLVSLKTSSINLMFEPSIKKDYKFMIREAILKKIGNIAGQLNKENKVLFIRSVWRSFDHQLLLWKNFYKLLRNKHPFKPVREIKEMVANFIALEKQSMHSTGGAVDALIYDLETNRIMDFGTNKGYNITLTKKCYPYYPNITPEARKNRKLLIGLFEKEDFSCDLREFWHFDYGNVIWAYEKKKEYAFYDILLS
jgi:D-alanyl-D-alanine dipeptidase